MKKSAVYLVSLLALTVLFFFACKKDLEEKEPNLQNHHNKKNSGLYELSGISVYNTVLCFNSRSDLYRLWSELNYQDSVFSVDTNLISEDTAFIIFENDLSFSSLRAVIEEQISFLESNDNLWDNNDPEKHFVVGNNIRAIVNPEAEVCVGDTIYKFLNPYAILMIIDDWNALDNFNNGYELEVISQANVKIINDEYPIEPLLHCNFSFNRMDKTVNFFNGSVYAGDFFWDFGDGSTSTSQNPTHSYASFGHYNVKLVCSRETNDGYTIYDEVTKQVSLTDCVANFDVAISSKWVTVLDKSDPIPGSSITFWEWDWGDGSAKEYGPSVNPNPKTHQYSTAGTYTIRLTIADNEFCEKFCDFIVHIPPDVCVADKKWRNPNPITYAGGSYKVDYVIKVRNAWLDTEIKAKIINYKRKNNGSWKRKKADDIWVEVSGYYYLGSDCSGNARRIDLTPDHSPHNRRKAKAETYLPEFSVGGNQIRCDFSVRNKEGGQHSFSVSIS